MLNTAKIAIVGGGVAGASTALYLGQLGMNITLFEKEQSLISGPPFCHLHAGGNLYRDISDKQCLSLLRQSIDFLRFYPFIVDYRPTVIALPIEDKAQPSDLLPRLHLLQEAYAKLIQKDPQNQVLGKSQDYYKSYSKSEIERLKALPLPTCPQSADEWMISLAKHIAIEKVQFPLILVQEYGLNLFRLASGLRLSLSNIQSLDLKMNTEITHIQASEEGYVLQYEDKKEYFDYLINATGFRSGKIDDILGISCKQMVEFKSAYVSFCPEYEDIAFPELIIHGERGTPQGMGQFTPYPQGYFQLHGMTHDITLYKDGLVHNKPLRCQAQLPKVFLDKIEKSWTKEEIQERTLSAIAHLAKFIPSFSHALVASKPLFGAQQIPGNDPSLRVAEVSFPKPHYARCEIVKVSSVLDMIDAIVKDLIALGYVKKDAWKKRIFEQSIRLNESQIHSLAELIAQERMYPPALASRNRPKPNEL